MFGDSNGWSEEYSFTAAPTPGTSETVRIIAYGGNTNDKRVRCPDLMGLNVYRHGWL